MDVILTQDQINFFHQNGYLSIDAITTPKEVERLKIAYDFIFKTRAGREKGDHFDLAGSDEDGAKPSLPQILGPRKYSPEFLNTIYEKNALSIAKQLIGPGAVFREDHAILKPPFHGAPAPWHQDESYWDPNFQYKSISFWMPLQDVNVANGCMNFIPLTKDMEILEHQSIGGDTRVHGLEIVDIGAIDISQARPCPIPAGGATVHSSRTLHSTGPNGTGTPRRAYTLSFSTPPIHTGKYNGAKFSWNEAKTTAREQRLTSSARDEKI